jgi:hypothetical protein
MSRPRRSTVTIPLRLILLSHFGRRASKHTSGYHGRARLIMDAEVRSTRTLARLLDPPTPDIFVAAGSEQPIAFSGPFSKGLA